MICFLLGQGCLAFDQGFYLSESDALLRCDGDNQFQYKDHKKMTRSEIELALKELTARKLLIVELRCGEANLKTHFPQPLKYDPNRVKLMGQVANNIEAFLKDLRFSRILVLACGGSQFESGYLVLRDLSYSDSSQK